MIENSSIWVVSDVDGTLMDHSYDLTPAKETIKLLQELTIPVILCTSKTAAEVKHIRKQTWGHKAYQIIIAKVLETAQFGNMPVRISNVLNNLGGTMFRHL